MVGRVLHADSRETYMKHILWLASWYPDEMSPYNGDFIQRHAIAVAQKQPLTVIYMAQHGPEVDIPASRVLTTKKDNLTEIIVYFSYKKTGIDLLDKLRYNWNYFYHYRRYLRQYISEKGRPDLVHVHIPMKAGRTAIWLQDEFKIPFIITEHSSAYSDEVPDSYHKRGSYYQSWVKRIFEQAEAVTTVSEKLGKKLQELFAIKNMHIIPNVADTRYFNFSPQAPARFRILHASTMDHPKNVEGILATLEQLKTMRTDWECIMLGWDTPALKKLSSEKGLDDHVTWKGVVSYQQVATEMKQASVFVLFSRYENQPCVILESLCSGLPVIATEVGGIPEIVHEQNGILVENGSHPHAYVALLTAIVKCMDEPNRFDRKAISENAQHLFSYDAVGKQFTDLYATYPE